MSSFTDNLDLRDLGDRTFQLLSTFRYHIGEELSTEWILVPSGFITDFASVPRILWNILPPHGKYGKAAVIHDALYATKGFTGKYTRKRCDQIFLEGMSILNVALPTRRIMYRGVRMGGWIDWRRKIDERDKRIFENTDLTMSEIVDAPKPISVGGPKT